MYYYDEERKKSIYVWIAVLILIVLLVNSPFIRRTRIFRVTRFMASNVLFPFKYIIHGAYDRSTSGVASFVRIKGVQKENESLKKEVDQYKTQVGLLNELVDENARLRAAMQFKARSGIPGLLAAEIIGRSGSNWFEVVEINRGSVDRVAPDSAVVNSEGLVGRVFDVSRFTSKVLLITDPTSAISVVDARTADMGIASGNSIGPVRIKYVSSTADIRIGDKIITSGMSDIFPKGIVLGFVRSVDKKDYDIFQKVEFTPAVKFSTLDKVFVVTK